MANKKPKYTHTEKRRHAEKYKALHSSGFSSKDAAKLSRGKTELSWKNIEKAKNYRGLTKVAMGGKVENVRRSEKRLEPDRYTVYTAKQYLTVLWVSFSGEVNFILGQKELSNETTERKAQDARKIYDNASKYDDSSGTSDGKALLNYGSKAGCEAFLDQKVYRIHEDNKERRRNGEPAISEYEIIIQPRNRFSADGMANLMLGVMAKCNDMSARFFYEDLSDYVRENLPEIYKMLF